MLKKVSLLLPLLLLSPFCSFAENCPPGVVFSHPIKGKPWYAEVNGDWLFNPQFDSEFSDVSEIPSTAVSVVYIDFHNKNSVYINCSYPETGNIAKVPMMQLSKRMSGLTEKGLSENFKTNNADNYFCEFKANDPNRCSWS